MTQKKYKLIHSGGIGMLYNKSLEPLFIPNELLEPVYDDTNQLQSFVLHEIKFNRTQIVGQGIQSSVYKYCSTTEPIICLCIKYSTGSIPELENNCSTCINKIKNMICKHPITNEITPYTIMECFTYTLADFLNRSSTKSISRIAIRIIFQLLYCMVCLDRNDLLNIDPHFGNIMVNYDSDINFFKLIMIDLSSIHKKSTIDQPQVTSNENLVNIWINSCKKIILHIIDPVIIQYHKRKKLEYPVVLSDSNGLPELNLLYYNIIIREIIKNTNLYAINDTSYLKQALYNELNDLFFINKGTLFDKYLKMLYFFKADLEELEPELTIMKTIMSENLLFDYDDVIPSIILD